MKARLITQPFVDGEDLRDFIASAASNPQITKLTIVAAWAKRSGVSRVAGALETIRARGGFVRAIVGVSEGGATRQGLEEIVDAVDEAFVYHDAGRTFHPKLYLAQGPTHAEVLVGSHNLTAGGLAWNHEAGIWLELDLPADKNTLDDVVGYVERLLADPDTCRPLDSHLIQALLKDKRIRIGDEDHATRPDTSDSESPADSDSEAAEAAGVATQGVFGKTSDGRRKPPAASKKSPASPRPKQTASSPAKKAAPGTKSSSGASSPVVRRWFKKMSNSDAQQPLTASTNPKGVMTFTERGHHIAGDTYFRQDFFGRLPWSSTPSAKGPVETTTASFDVHIGGSSIGTFDLMVDHADHRASGQGNVTTWLHWGPDLGVTLRGMSHVGEFCTVESLADDTYRLTIAAKATGSSQP